MTSTAAMNKNRLLKEREQFSLLQQELRSRKCQTNVAVLQELGRRCRKEENIHDRESFEERRSPRKSQENTPRVKRAGIEQTLWRLRGGFRSVIENPVDDSTNVISRFARSKYEYREEENISPAERQTEDFKDNIQELLMKISSTFAGDINEAMKSDDGNPQISVESNNATNALHQLQAIGENMAAIDNDMAILKKNRTAGHSVHGLIAELGVESGSDCETDEHHDDEDDDDDSSLDDDSDASGSFEGSYEGRSRIKTRERQSDCDESDIDDSDSEDSDDESDSDESDSESDSSSCDSDSDDDDSSDCSSSVDEDMMNEFLEILNLPNDESLRIQDKTYELRDGRYDAEEQPELAALSKSGRSTSTRGTLSSADSADIISSSVAIPKEPPNSRFEFKFDPSVITSTGNLKSKSSQFPRFSFRDGKKKNNTNGQKRRIKNKHLISYDSDHSSTRSSRARQRQASCRKARRESDRDFVAGLRVLAPRKGREIEEILVCG